MLLVIDCGNTNTVMAVYIGKTKKGEWRMVTDAKQTSDDHIVWLNYHLGQAGLDMANVTDIVIASVVPACMRSFEGIALRLGARSFIIDAGDDKHGVEIKIPEAKQAGADRIANAMAARLYSLPAIVVDFGTATTFDLVDGDGAYIGGAIAPGIDLSISALYQGAARLPLIDAREWSASSPVIGKTTEAAMNSGLYYGYIGLTEGMITRLETSYGENMTVIATGGHSGLFAGAINKIAHHDPDLTLKGMAMIYQHQLAD